MRRCFVEVAGGEYNSSGLVHLGIRFLVLDMCRRQYKAAQPILTRRRATTAPVTCRRCAPTPQLPGTI